MLITVLLCDLLYPILLAHVKRTEVVLEDGTVVAGTSDEARRVKGAVKTE